MKRPKVCYVSLLLSFSASLAPVFAVQVDNPVVAAKPEDDRVVQLPIANLGFIPSRRVLVDSRSGNGIRSAKSATESDPISATERGVVFNYAMRTYGLISGEIAFEVQTGVDVRNFPWGVSGSPTVLVSPSVYVVNSTNGSEFVRLVSMLKTSTAVKWVEPAVDYIPHAVE